MNTLLMSPQDLVNDFIAQGLLKYIPEDVLKQEIRRRIDVRKSLREKIDHCKECKFMASGHSKRSAYYTTLVCLAKPKPKAGEDRYYATSSSKRACELFQPKDSV